MTVSLISKLKELTKKIESELDAHTFVRIYLDALGIEDRDKIYDALGESDPRFKDIFVLRIIIPTQDFMANGQVKLGGNTIPNLVIQNGYHGILYIKEGSGKHSSKDPIIDEYHLQSSAFVPRNGTVYIPNGTNTNREILDLAKEGVILYGVLEIHTDNYQECPSSVKRVKLGRKTSTQKEAIINTQFEDEFNKI